MICSAGHGKKVMRWQMAGIAVACLILAANNSSAQTPAPTGQPAPSHQAQRSELSAIKNSIEQISRAEEAQVQREAENTDDHASRDLAAQEAMATWAKFSFFVTLASVILSGGGLIALLYSLRLNRNATNAAQNAVIVARDTNEAQSRAWVSVNCQLGKPTRGTTHGGIEGVYFDVACLAQNHGRSPATSVSFHAEIALLGPGAPSMEGRMIEYCNAIRERAEHEAEAIFPEAVKQLGHMVFLPTAEIEAAMADRDFKMIAPIVYGCLNYQSPYTKGVRQTRFAYSVVSVNESGQAVVLMPNKCDWLDQPIHLAGPGTIITD
jgi:hypothetical protein